MEQKLEFMLILVCPRILSILNKANNLIIIRHDFPLNLVCYDALNI